MDVPCDRSNAPVLYLVDHRKHVNLGLLQGTRLDDPYGFLDRTGKSMRHVKLRAKAERTPGLAGLLRAAVAHRP